jgi:hypothetical protein
MSSIRKSKFVPNNNDLCTVKKKIEKITPINKKIIIILFIVKAKKSYNIIIENCSNG